MTERGWQQRFDAPIPLPSGGDLVTLRDAANLILKLPPREAKAEHWQLAMHLLIWAADSGGIVLMARMAMTKALGHGKPPPTPDAQRKAAKQYRLIR